MEQDEGIAKQMIDLSRTMLLDSYDRITSLQENMVDMYLSMLPLVSDDNRRFIRGLLLIHKKGREYLSPFRKAGAADTRLILDDIEEKILGKMDFGFNPDILNVLNDPNAGRRDIEALKGKISPEILAKVMDLANSAYFGSLKKGKVKTFYDAVILLGMKHTELLILYFSLFVMVTDKNAELILAKSFARYALGGYIYAKDFGLNDEATYKVELGCLFMDIGKIVIHLYRAKYEEDYRRFALDETFIENNHAHLGLRICDSFNIPEELKRMIFYRHFTLDAKHIALSGILKTVYHLVESIFEENGGKMVITSPMPDAGGRLTHSLGIVIRDLFDAIGLSGYLEIVGSPVSSLQEDTSG